MEAITIYAKADANDVYLMHRGIMTPGQELVATIIEWADCIELRVARKLDADEHAAVMAFVARLKGSTATLIGLDASDYEYLARNASKGGLMIPKEEMQAAAPAARMSEPVIPAHAAPKPGRPRMVALPSSRSERIQDGWIRNLHAMTHDPAKPACWACKGKGSYSDYVRSGRDRLVRCNVCEGTGNAEPRRAKVVA